MTKKYLPTRGRQYQGMHFYLLNGPVQPEFSFLMGRFPEFTTNYLTLVLGLCATREIMTLLELVQDEGEDMATTVVDRDSMPARVADQLGPIYQKIEQNDLAQRSRYQFFSEIDIFTIDEGGTKERIARTETLEDCMDHYEEMRLRATGIPYHVLIPYVFLMKRFNGLGCGFDLPHQVNADAVRIEYVPHEGEVVTISEEDKFLVKLLPEEKRRYQTLSPEQKETFKEMSDASRASYVQLMQEQEDRAGDDKYFGYGFGPSTMVDPFELFPRFLTFTGYFARVVLFTGVWVVIEQLPQVRKTEKSPTKVLSFNCTLDTHKTFTPKPWNLNEPLFVSQQPLIDYKSSIKKDLDPVSTDYYGFNGVPTHDQVDFSRFRKMPPGYPRDFVQNFPILKEEFTEQDLRSDQQPFQTKLNFLRLLLQSRIKENGLMPTQSPQTLDQNKQLLQTHVQHMDQVYLNLVEDLYLKPFTPYSDISNEFEESGVFASSKRLFQTIQENVGAIQEDETSLSTPLVLFFKNRLYEVSGSDVQVFSTDLNKTYQTSLKDLRLNENWLGASAELHTFAETKTGQNRKTLRNRKTGLGQAMNQLAQTIEHQSIRPVGLVCTPRFYTSRTNYNFNPDPQSAERQNLNRPFEPSSWVKQPWYHRAEDFIGAFPWDYTDELPTSLSTIDVKQFGGEIYPASLTLVLEKNSTIDLEQKTLIPSRQVPRRSRKRSKVPPIRYFSHRTEFQIFDFNCRRWGPEIRLFLQTNFPIPRRAYQFTRYKNWRHLVDPAAKTWAETSQHGTYQLLTHVITNPTLLELNVGYVAARNEKLSEEDTTPALSLELNPAGLVFLLSQNSSNWKTNSNSVQDLYLNAPCVTPYSNQLFTSGRKRYIRIDPQWFMLTLGLQDSLKPKNLGFNPIPPMAQVYFWRLQYQTGPNEQIISTYNKLERKTKYFIKSAQKRRDDIQKGLNSAFTSNLSPGMKELIFNNLLTTQLDNLGNSRLTFNLNLEYYGAPTEGELTSMESLLHRLRTFHGEDENSISNETLSSLFESVNKLDEFNSFQVNRLLRQRIFSDQEVGVALTRVMRQWEHVTFLDSDWSEVDVRLKLRKKAQQKLNKQVPKPKKEKRKINSIYDARHFVDPELNRSTSNVLDSVDQGQGPLHAVTQSKSLGYFGNPVNENLDIGNSVFHFLHDVHYIQSQIPKNLLNFKTLQERWVEFFTDDDQTHTKDSDGTIKAPRQHEFNFNQAFLELYQPSRFETFEKGKFDHIVDPFALASSFFVSSSAAGNSHLDNKQKQHKLGISPETLWRTERLNRTKYNSNKYEINDQTVKTLSNQTSIGYSKDSELNFPFIDNYLDDLNTLVFNDELTIGLVANSNDDYPHLDYLPSNTTEQYDANPDNIGQYRYLPFLTVLPTNRAYWEWYPQFSHRTIYDTLSDQNLKLFQQAPSHDQSQLVLVRNKKKKKKEKKEKKDKNPDIYYRFSHLFERSALQGYYLERHPKKKSKDVIFELENDLYAEILDSDSLGNFMNIPDPDPRLAGQRVLEYSIQSQGSTDSNLSFLREEPYAPLIKTSSTPVSDTITASERVWLEALGFDLVDSTPHVHDQFASRRGQPVSPIFTRYDNYRLAQGMQSYEWVGKYQPPLHVARAFTDWVKTGPFDQIANYWLQGDQRSSLFGRAYWSDWPSVYAEDIDESLEEWENWDDYRLTGVNSGVIGLFRLLLRPVAVESAASPITFFTWICQLFVVGIIVGTLFLGITYIFSADITGNYHERKYLQRNHPFYGYELENFRKVIMASIVFRDNHPLRSLGFSFYVPEQNNIHFGDVGDSIRTYDEVICDMVYYLDRPRDFHEDEEQENLLEDIIAGKKDVVIPTTPIKSYFFIGRSGTGKETTVKAIARELNLTLYSVSAKKFAKTAGMSIIDCIRFCFELADLQSPSIMYVSDFESLTYNRSYVRKKKDPALTYAPNQYGEDGGTYRDPAFLSQRANVRRTATNFQLRNKQYRFQEKIIMTLLVEFDLLYKYNYPFLFIASSTNPKYADPALLRPGRLGKILAFGILTGPGRSCIMRANSGGYPYAADVDWYRVMADTTGHFGKQIAKMCNTSMNLMEKENGYVHTNGTLETAEVVRTISIYKELNKKSDAQKALEYELGLEAEEEKIPDDFWYIHRAPDVPTFKERRKTMIADETEYERDTMSLAYYQTARFFVFKWVEDPGDIRQVRFLNRKVEETMDFLRVENVFMPWASDQSSVILNYILYLISGLAGEWLYYKGRFGHETRCLDRLPEHRQQDFEAFDTYVNHLYLNFDPLRENFKKNQPLLFMHVDYWAHQQGSGRLPIFTDAWRSIGEVLNSTTVFKGVFMPRELLLNYQDDLAFKYNFKRNKDRRTYKNWFFIDSYTNSYSDLYQRGCEADPVHTGNYSWLVPFLEYDPTDDPENNGREDLEEPFNTELVKYYHWHQNYTGLTQTAATYGHKEQYWQRQARMQALIVTSTLLDLFRPLVDFVAYTLAKDGQVPHTIIRSLFKPEFCYTFAIKDQRLTTALSNDVPARLEENTTIQTSPYAFTFKTGKTGRSINQKYEQIKVKKVMRTSSNVGYVTFNQGTGQSCYRKTYNYITDLSYYEHPAVIESLGVPLKEIERDLTKKVEAENNRQVKRDQASKVLNQFIEQGNLNS